jgi:hypothetical protein
MPKESDDQALGSRWRAPRVSLKEAIERVKKIWDKDGRSGSSRDSAVRHMGYNKLHGASAMMLADLNKFKLTFGDNKRIMLTREALEILAGSDEQKKAEAIRACALAPGLYRNLYEKYKDAGKLPSAETLKSHLLLDFELNKNKVDEITLAIQETFRFAKVFEGWGPIGAGTAKQVKELDDTMGEVMDFVDADTEVKRQGVFYTRDYSIPRKGDKIAILRLEYPVSKEDIEQIKKWLELMGNTIPDDRPKDGN